MRSGRDYGSQSHQSTGQFGEPMEVDYLKPMKKCQFCQKSGHTTRFCHMIRDYQKPLSTNNLIRAVDKVKPIVCNQC